VRRNLSLVGRGRIVIDKKMRSGGVEGGFQVVSIETVSTLHPTTLSPGERAGVLTALPGNRADASKQVRHMALIIFVT